MGVTDRSLLPQKETQKLSTFIYVYTPRCRVTVSGPIAKESERNMGGVRQRS